MAKDSKKRYILEIPQIHYSDDEGSFSNDDDDLTSLFANLTKDQKKKINELIESINEKMISWNANRTCSLRKIKSLLS